MSSNTTTVNTILAAPNYVSAVFLSLTQLFGVLGNVLVIYSIISHRSLLKSNYYFLVLHLAFCDLIVLLLSSYDTYEAWYPNSFFIRSSPMCKMWGPMITIFFNAGIYLVVLIGIFRCRAVLHPLKRAVSRSKLRVVVGAVYFCAIACVVPFILVLKFTDDVCSEKWPNPTLNIIYTFFLTIVQYFLPVLILFILYYKICKALNIQSKKILSSNATSEDSNGRQTRLQRMKHYRNIRTFIQSASIVVLFAITSLPSQILWLMQICGVTVQTEVILTWTNIVSLFGVNAVNPYIYGVSDRTLRSAYKRIWEKVKRIFASSSSKTDLCVAVSLNKTSIFVKISEYRNVSVMLD